LRRRGDADAIVSFLWAREKKKKKKKKKKKVRRHSPVDGLNSLAQKVKTNDSASCEVKPRDIETAGCPSGLEAGVGYKCKDKDCVLENPVVMMKRRSANNSARNREIYRRKSTSVKRF
jgi:hypothetical protein